MVSTYPTLTETRHSGGFMVSHANGERSFDQGVIENNTGSVFEMAAGTVLALQSDGSYAPVVHANVDGALTSVSGLTPGVGYTALPTFSTASGSGGTFAVTMKALTATVVAGGTSGFAVNDTVTLAGATGTEPVLTVDTVDGGGHILTAHVSTPGALTALHANPVSQGSTSGSGVGTPTFTMTYGVASIAVSGGTTYSQGDALISAGGSPSTAATGAINVSTSGDVVASAILYNTEVLPVGSKKCTIVTRAAEVNGSELYYNGLSNLDIATVNTQLTALGIIVR